MTTLPALLDESGALEHLQRRGLIDGAERATARRLSGGVSNVVLVVESGSRRLVVKQALPRLRVEEEWLADPARTVTEGRALRRAATVNAESVPAVLDLDEERCVLAIAAAPPGTADWKAHLMRGEVDLDVAARVGDMVGRLHAATADDPLLHTAFDRWEAFEQLRVAPYFRAMVERHPQRRDLVMPHVEAMRDRRRCLVHGDVSPKNVLTGPGLLWLIDFEVACAGDPAFDVAFMLCHLTMKALHRTADPDLLARAARTFLAAYRDHAGALLGDDAHVAALLGCLLLARCDGRSPAEYLDPRSQPLVRGAGLRLAAEPPPSLDGAISAVMR